MAPTGPPTAFADPFGTAAKSPGGGAEGIGESGR